MPNRRRLITIIVAAATIISCGSPAWAADDLVAPDQIVLSGRADVPRGRTVGQVVVFRGVASIQGVAHGDVVVLSGRANIGGQVSGNVVALDGTVVLGPAAQVRGDVISRGTVAVREGAQVQGEIRRNVPLSLRAPLEIVGPFATWLAVTVSVLLLGLLLLWIAPRGSDAVLATARRAPWASAGLGIGFLLGVPLLALGLALTLVGLPLALVVLLALGLVLFVGYAWAAWILGRALLPPPRGRIVTFLVGFAILRIAGALPLVGGISWILASALGIGAGIVAIWSARGVGGKHRLGRPPLETAAWGQTESEAPPADAAFTAAVPDLPPAAEPPRDDAIDPEFPSTAQGDGVNAADEGGDADGGVEEEEEDWMPLVRADAPAEGAPDADADAGHSTPAPSSGSAPSPQP